MEQVQGTVRNQVVISDNLLIVLSVKNVSQGIWFIWYSLSCNVNCSTLRLQPNEEPTDSPTEISIKLKSFVFYSQLGLCFSEWRDDKSWTDS